jgi:hypothetical protein
VPGRSALSLQLHLYFTICVVHGGTRTHHRLLPWHENCVLQLKH